MKVHKKKLNISNISISAVALLSVFAILYASILYVQEGFTHPLFTNKTLYIQEDGTRLKGLHEINDNFYYFDDKTGFLQTGFFKKKNQTYYANEKGQLQTGLQKIGQDTYYFDSNGCMVKQKYVGFEKNDQEIIYYFGKDGKKVSGEEKINGQTQTFDETGNLQYNVSPLQDQIQKIVDKEEGFYGVYFKDLRSGQSFSINDKSMYPCCMIKTVALGATFQAIEQGRLSYEDHRTEIEQMITISSNTAYNNLMINIGNGNGLNGLAQANNLAWRLGMNNTYLHHGIEPGENFFTDGGENISCPSDIGRFFEALYNHQVVSETSDEQMIELFKKCEDYTALQRGLPKGTEFAHKTGCADFIYNDGGIVFLDGRDYILSVFSQDPMVHYPDVMEDISKTVYEYQENFAPDLIYLD